MHLLAISGSLRSGASNTAVLRAAALVAPPGMAVALYEELGSLPHFDPDLDTPGGETLPAIVGRLRELVGRSDGILISSPEYAHGIPGSLKNLLDWLVGSVEFPGKPAALLNTSAHSVHAPAQLAEVLATMSARLVREACVTLPLPRRGMDAAEIAEDSEAGPVLRDVLARMMAAAGDPSP